MKAEIIATGTEILLGEIVDTNTSFLASELALLGIDIHFTSSIGDNFDRFSDVLRQAWQRSDIIITTGGLGPTQGDITRNVIAAVIREEAYVDGNLKQNIIGYFSKLGPEPDLPLPADARGCKEEIQDFRLHRETVPGPVQLERSPLDLDPSHPGCPGKGIRSHPAPGGSLGLIFFPLRNLISDLRTLEEHPAKRNITRENLETFQFKLRPVYQDASLPTLGAERDFRNLQTFHDNPRPEQVQLNPFHSHRGAERAAEDFLTDGNQPFRQGKRGEIYVGHDENHHPQYHPEENELPQLLFLSPYHTCRYPPSVLGRTNEISSEEKII